MQKKKAAANNSSVNMRANRKTKDFRKQKWEQKQLYRYFKRQTWKIAPEKTWNSEEEEISKEKLNLLYKQHNIRTQYNKTNIDQTKE